MTTIVKALPQLKTENYRVRFREGEYNLLDWILAKD